MPLFEDLAKFNKRQEAVVTAFSRVGYRVVPTAGGPRIDRERKIVFMPNVDASKFPNVISTIRGWTDHEMSHELYKSDTELLKKVVKGGDKKLEHIFRYIEDGRVERLISRDFVGCGENLRYLEKESIADRKKMGLALYIATKHGKEGVESYGMGEWAEILGDDLIKECQSAQTCAESLEVAKKAYKRIKDWIDEGPDGEDGGEEDPEGEKHPGRGKKDKKDKKDDKKGKKREGDDILDDGEEKEKKEKSDDKGTDGESDEESDSSEGDSDGESDAGDAEDGTETDKDSDGSRSEETGHGESKKLSDDKTPVKSKRPSLDEMIPDEKEDLMDKVIEKLSEDLAGLGDSAPYTPYVLNDKIVDLTKDYRDYNDRRWFPGLINEAKSKVNALASKLRLELFATKMLHERYKDRGLLDQRRLHMLGMGTTADVFMKRVDKPELDTAVTLLIDASGSMEGDKILLAAQIAYLLSMTMESLRIPNEVLSFTARWHTSDTSRDGHYTRRIPLWHFIHKGFSNALKHCTESMNRIGTIMDQNTDGESVLWAAARLATRKEKRKILFVLSDGEPYDGSTAGLNQHLKDIVEMVSRHGIECIGIGMMTGSVQRFYKNYVVIHNVNDLVTKAYAKIVEAIRGAKKGVK